MTAPVLLHTARLAVRWGDLDALNHVNNSRYFTYMEQARIESFEVLGYPIRPRARCPSRRLSRLAQNGLHV